MNNYQHVIDTFTFITGEKGAFEFKVDGELLFSKKDSGQHAEPGEILDVFKKHVGPDVSTYPEQG